MSLRNALLDEIRRGRVLEDINPAKIIEPVIFEGLAANSLMMHFTQFFNNDICSDFKLILKRKNPTDVNELDVYGNKKVNVIYAHKFVLAQSEWFRAIFDSNMMEQVTNELIVNEDEENLDTFTAMIAMMYSNYVPSFTKLNSSLVTELLVCFDKYQATNLFDRLVSGLIKNLALNTPEYKSDELLWLFSMFGDRIKSQELDDSIQKLHVLPLWSKVHIVGYKIEEKRDNFTNFFNKQDFNSCYFFLEKFVRPNHSFEVVCTFIDDWIKYDEADRFDKGFLLYRVALTSHQRPNTY